METIQKIFEQQSSDSKNILNRAANVSLSKEVLNSIEDNGITSEQLENLGVPVFKYQTQITIHGIFPILEGNGRIGGYKWLFQNKNLSLGVKYNAIDATKKAKVYSTICLLSDFIEYTNSTENFIYKYYFVNSIADAKTKALEITKELEHIDKTLFYGNFGVNILKDMFGRIIIEKFINVNAIYEKNVNAFIANVLKISVPEIEINVNAKKDAIAKKELENKQKYEAERLAIAEAKKPLIETARKYLTDNNYVKFENVKLYDGLVVVEGIEVFIEDKFNNKKNDIKYRVVKYTKSKQQKKFHFIVNEYANEIPENMVFTKSYSDNKTDKTVLKFAYIKEEIKNVKPIEDAKPIQKTVNENKPMETNLKIVGVEIQDYSEKSFVVFGNTKSIKETLKSLGGRFNPYLTVGAGWVFSKQKKEAVLSFLK